MQVTARSKKISRLQTALFVVLFLVAIGLLAWLSTRYALEADWTAGNRHTLQPASQRLLERLDEPLAFTVYGREQSRMGGQIRDLIARYQRVRDDIELHYVNPDTVPQKLRDLGIRQLPTLVLAHQGRTEKIENFTEQAVTNAILRVARRGERRVVFVTGHGERDPHGQNRQGLSYFTKQLQDSGLTVATHNLAKSGALPDDTALTVIASPRQGLLDSEVALLQRYVRDGGNLLWLAEPGDRRGLEPLAERLGVSFPTGTVIEPSEAGVMTEQGLMMVERPTLNVVVTDYTRHPVTREVGNTLFSEAAAIETSPPKPWSATSLARTASKAWLETGSLDERVEYNKDSDDMRGPLTLASVLTRKPQDRQKAATEEAGTGGDQPQTKPGATGADTGKDDEAEQRVAVVGDGDFLSNAFITQGGNRDLALNLVNWLVGEGRFVNITPKEAPDTQLDMPPGARMALLIGFPVVLPLLLIGLGVGVWLRRRQR